jgi:uncharacterized protein YgiM (DUF1202 family)
VTDSATTKGLSLNKMLLRSLEGRIFYHRNAHRNLVGWVIAALMLPSLAAQQVSSQQVLDGQITAPNTTEADAPVDPNQNATHSRVNAPPSNEQTLNRENKSDNEAVKQFVIVAEPFINLYTGPGRGYPIFYIVEQGGRLGLIKRKYNWFKVITEEGKVGWIPLNAIQLTTNLDGSPVNFKEYSELDFIKRDYEFGFRAGDFEGANLLSVSGAWQFTENLATEITLGQALGDFSEVRQVTASVTNTPFPDWRFSPYFGIGGGFIQVFPNAALVQEVDRKDEVVFSTLGLKSYITERFLFRLEYRSYVVLTTQETNEKIEEWTMGFSVFF